MKHHEREFFVNIISSGTIKCKIGDQTFYIAPALAEDKIEAFGIYSKTYMEAELGGSITFEESVDHLFDKGLWTEEDESLLEETPEKIENLKLALYESFFKEKTRLIIKRNLKTERKALDQLLKKKNSLINYTCEGVAESAKIEYLVYSSVLDSNRNRLIEKEPYADQDSNFIVQAVEHYHRLNTVDESIYRELARNEPWKAIWGASKTGMPLFNAVAADLTDSQKILINWSRLYDNIYESPDCPPDEIIKDDDALDGWLISQHRKREKEINTNAVDARLSEKTRNAQEVFLPVDSDKEAEKIHNMNNPLAKRQSRQRFRKVEKEGDVGYQEFADVKQKIQMQAMQEWKNK